MNVPDRVGTILDIQCEAERLIIRYNIGLYLPDVESQAREHPVGVLELEGWTKQWNQEAFPFVAGEVVVYTIQKEEDGFHVTLYDAIDEEWEIRCTNVQETMTDYSVADWQTKYGWLLQQYKETDSERESLYRRFTAQTHELTRELSRGLDHCARKLDFYSQRNAEANALQIAEVAGQRKTFARICTVLEYLEQQKPGG